MQVEEESGTKGEEEVLSKAEARRLETERRIKRIHELLELIQKKSEEINSANQELNTYQNELCELVKSQVSFPLIRQRRERRNKESEDEEKGGGKGGKSGKEEVGGEKKSPFFNKFFFVPPPPPVPPPVPEPVSHVSHVKELTPSPIKRRARAVSYDELDKEKKVKMENFEITDIFQLKSIDVDFVRECLEKCDISSDIKLFRRIFIRGIPKDQQLLRYLGGKNYQTKRNGLWIDDLNGSYIKHVLVKIYEQSYLQVNDLEHYGENMDRFLSNQEHIHEFGDDKYVEKLMNQITGIIDIKAMENK